MRFVLMVGGGEGCCMQQHCLCGTARMSCSEDSQNDTTSVQRAEGWCCKQARRARPAGGRGEQGSAHLVALGQGAALQLAEHVTHSLPHALEHVGVVPVPAGSGRAPRRWVAAARATQPAGRGRVRPSFPC
jgi:hypothetical protein